MVNAKCLIWAALAWTLACQTWTQASVKVDISPPGAVDAEAQWRLISDPCWFDSGQVHPELPSRKYEIEFADLAQWREPQPLYLWHIQGYITDANAVYQRLPEFEVGSIPRQRAWHETTLEFLIRAESCALPTANPTPLGPITLDPAGTADLYLFHYTPDPHDKEPFAISFHATSAGQPVSQDVIITPMPHISPEAEVFGLGGKASDPCATDDIDIDDKRNSEPNDFNYLDPKPCLRVITITGDEVIIEKGNPNHIYNNYNENADIGEFTVYAVDVIIRSPFHLPQTNVNIHAQNLIIEGNGCIKTTPIDNPIPEPNQFADGAHGLKAGDIALNIQSFQAPDPCLPDPCNPGSFLAPDPCDPNTYYPLDLRGGRGQNAGRGRPGVNGASRTMRDDHCSWEGFRYNAKENHKIIWFKRTLVCSGYCRQPSPREYGTHAWPGNGTNATCPGKPGNGGDGGSIRSALDVVMGYASFTGGSTGQKASDCPGGKGGSPRNATRCEIKLMRGNLITCLYFQKPEADPFCDHKTFNVSHHTSTDGKSYTAPDPCRPFGDPGKFMLVGDPMRWLKPKTLNKDACVKSIYSQKTS